MRRDSREVATANQEKIRRAWSGERGGGGKRRREPSPSLYTDVGYILSPAVEGLWRENRGSVNRLAFTFFSHSKPRAFVAPGFLRSLHINRELSKDVFEQRTSTVSETFSFLICVDAPKFVLLSVFIHIKAISQKVGKNHWPRMQKSLLPVDIRRLKTALFKLLTILEPETG